MRGRLGWVVRIGLMLVVLALVIHRASEHKTAKGFVVGITSANCSVEQMQPDTPPLKVRLLYGGQVVFNTVWTVSHEQALDILSSLNKTRTDRLLLMDWDESFTVQDIAGFLNETHSAMPTWRVLLMTPETRPACEQLIKMRSHPAH